jgi:hypothetical protein
VTMLPDTVRSRIAALLRLVAAEGAAVAVCSSSHQVEVTIGDVTPFLGLADTSSGLFLQDMGGHKVLVSELVGGHFLIAALEDQDQLGDVIGAVSDISNGLASLLSLDDPEPGPASAQAQRASKQGAA